ncbi:integrase [Hydrogenovibrio sp. SC-1]|uniref:tyrosine-type recombinase/integrase n=1 Tax=Hydrogenovibrio sp. SC-1 TaxID=2065820 RepID=UPI000C7BDF4B|nr:tyrosine-type recombinase/integrase [Hydrogenovibrio sp. SC-1]PLA73488.1 integrase [Hydrogenovibrio sp. SC-1]
MGVVSVKKETGHLYLDFYYLKTRCKEYTKLSDNKANRKKLGQVLKVIEGEIAMGSFQYEKYFPNSSRLQKIKKLEDKMKPDYRETPLFKDFAEEWFSEMLPTWRRATAEGYRRYLDKRLVPHFGEMEVSRITKAEILKYRSSVAKQSDGKLKAKTINKFIKCLGMIMNEAADRYDFTPPHLNIKPLKEEKVHIQPFSIDEVNQLLANVREDWRDYYLIRFFTGMRTGEIDGLKWENVDFERREILVRETFSGNKWEYTKNDGSQREVEMSTLVFNCLKTRYEKHKNGQNTQQEYKTDLVFHNNVGQPVHASNFLRRVWTPLLNYLGIKYRKPYQTRHTAATLWLAAGENPSWIAKQMGHANTNMLFSVYARYVPNLTRKDGSAMERLLAQQVQSYHQPIKLKSRDDKPEDANQAQQTEEIEEAQEVAFWDQFIQLTESQAGGVQ